MVTGGAGFLGLVLTSARGTTLSRADGSGLVLHAAAPSSSAANSQRTARFKEDARSFTD
jgi:hypothetical protein